MRIKRLNEKIRVLRAVSGLTLLEFCKAIGISTTTMARWQSGDDVISESSVARMCEFFGYTFEQFLDESFPAQNDEALLCMQHLTIKRASRAAKRARS